MKRIGMVSSRTIKRQYVNGRFYQVTRVARILDRSELSPGDIIVTVRRPNPDHGRQLVAIRSAAAARPANCAGGRIHELGLCAHDSHRAAREFAAFERTGWSVDASLAGSAE